MIIRKLKDALREKAWIFLKVKWKLRSGLFIKVENDSDWFVFNEIFTNKEYDPAFRLFLSNISSNPLVVDLGANVGYFTLRVADEMLLAGHTDFTIVSLEASPSNFAILQRRLVQPLLKNKVKYFLGLAGHKTGSASVVHSNQHYGHSSAGDAAAGTATTVSYVDIETLTGSNEKRIGLLKCDIEGSEEIFISAYAGLLQRVDTAVFELHAGECNVENCRKMLENAGLFSKGIIKEDPPYRTTVEIFSRL
ncbi:MAG: FkbM family methyltransferase [Chitinophagaceae bacterium]